MAYSPLPVAGRTKIFYFIPNLQQGGTEGQILELINNLPERFEPVLCVYNTEQTFFDARCPEGQPKHSLGVRRMNMGALGRLTEILRQEKPDILHSFRDKANFWACWAAARAGIPITITACRNRMMQPRYVVAEWFMSRQSRLILVNSVGVQQELTRWARVSADRVRVIHNSIDIEHFRPPMGAERAEARARWNLAPGQRAILLPGRVGLQKHQIGMLWAMRSLARRGRWPDNAVVLLAGRERDRGMTALVHRLARAPSIAPYVRLLGPVKEIRSLYWAADVLAMPSLYEGLANAALEGCASGLPALLSHAVNLDGIIQPGEAGWEVPTGRHRPLVQALEEVLSASDEELARMGPNARAHVAARFAPSRDFALSQTVAVYDELLGGSGRDSGSAARRESAP